MCSVMSNNESHTARKRLTDDFSKVEAIIIITLVDSLFCLRLCEAERRQRCWDEDRAETCLSDGRRGNAHTDTQTLIITLSVLVSSLFTQHSSRRQSSSFKNSFFGAPACVFCSVEVFLQR